MTKRILALLLAALFAVSCCMMTACGDDSGKTNDDQQQQGDNKPAEGDKTDDKTPADNKDKEDDKTPADDDKDKDDDKDDDKDSEPAVDEEYEPSDEFEGEVLNFAFFESAKWEAWTGPGHGGTYCWWQAVIGLPTDEYDFTKDSYGSDDSPWTWTLNIRPAEAHDDDDPENDKWWTVECQCDTIGKTGDTNLYRPQPGTGFDGKFQVGIEYEVVLQVTSADKQYKSLAMYFDWDQNFEDQYQNWKAGKNADGTPGTCWVPEHAPHEGLTPTPRPVAGA